ncbi:MAG: signal peptidase I [Eubacteriales bacterium]|nr:signal peptidase I [Eubacteriales bacterium]
MIFIAGICGYVLIAFCFQTVTVVGPSMHGTLEDGQVVYVNKLAYKIGDVKRFDVVAYKKVGTDSYYDIKRVIGLPNEKIQIREGIVYINGQAMMEPPFQELVVNSGIASAEISLGKNEYFILGDNVNNSEDSRYTNIGNISKSEILGRVDRILSPRKDKGKVK